MIGLVLVTHGRLAEEFVAATEHVVGRQPNTRAVCIGADDDMEVRRKDILAAISEVDDEARRVIASGYLTVDGRTIYHMADFSLEIERKSE